MSWTWRLVPFFTIFWRATVFTLFSFDFFVWINVKTWYNTIIKCVLLFVPQGRESCRDVQPQCPFIMGQLLMAINCHLFYPSQLSPVKYIPTLWRWFSCSLLHPFSKSFKDTRTFDHDWTPSVRTVFKKFDEKCHWSDVSQCCFQLSNKISFIFGP